MRHRQVRLACLGLACALSSSWLATSAPAYAQTETNAARISVREAGVRRTIACDGRSVAITGATNEVTLTGECSRVTITGAGNTVAIDAVGRIDVTGAFNKVTWRRALDGDAPRVTRTGTGSTVTRVPQSESSSSSSSASSGASAPSAPAASQPPVEAPGGRVAAAPVEGDPSSGTVSSDGRLLKVLASNETSTVDCGSRDVDIVGSHNTLTLTGPCGRVRVTGSTNTVTVDTVARIVTTGADNHVTWTRAARGSAEPSVLNTGSGNVIRQAAR